MGPTLVTRPPHTPADRWVTADQARRTARDGLADAATAPDPLRTLAELDRARRASLVAARAAAEALLAAGTGRPEIAAALGPASAEDVREALGVARGDAESAIEERLGHRA